MSVLTSVSGFPRIGQNRELKKIIEAYWKGVATLDDVRATAKELRAKHWKLQQEAGIDLIPSNDFSYYDQMLDTAILLNVIPQRYQRLAFDNPEETLFAMGRGYQGDKGDVTALPMKKWFTTNYHYLVPEVESAAEIKLNSTKPFDEFNEAKALGIDTKPVFIGPYTFLKLARTPEATELELDKGLVNAVAAVYVEVLAKFNELGAAWVQLDEPYLVLDKEPGDVELFKTLYTKILSAKGNVKVLLNTYFGHIADVYETVNLLGFDGIGLDLNEGREENLEAVAKYGVASNTTIFAGVINGRNIWRNNYATSLGLVDALKQVTANVAVSTASSLLHVPFSTEGEDGLADDETRKPDDHDAGAGVDVHRLLILAHHGPGKGCQGVGYAQSYRDGERRVQGRGPHHVGIVTCGPNGKAHACFQKCQQQYACQNGDRSRQQQLVPIAADAAVPQKGEDRAASQQALVGFPAHRHQIDGVQARVGDDARQNGGNPQASLQKSCDESGAAARQHGGRNGQNRVSPGGQRDRDRRPKDKTTVGGHIGDVQDPEAQKQGHGHQSV